MNSKAFFDTEDIQLDFQVPMEQGMNNLQQRVKPSTDRTPTRQETMVGGVSKESTYIYRSVPGSRNSFRPTFYGYFTDEGSSTTLVGEITLNRVIKKFIVLWCAIVALMAVATLITLLRNPAASWGSLIYVVVMLFVCMFFFRTMIKKSSADKDWLKKEISHAISGS